MLEPYSDKNWKPAKDLVKYRKPTFPGESPAYKKARDALFQEEIEVRRHMTALAKQRQALPPGPLVEKNYKFKDENGNSVGLIDLFGEHSTLITYFWMYGPERERPCPMCTNWLGSVNGNALDVKQRAALKIFGRSPIERQIAFAKERGWQHLDFLQTATEDYAKDLGMLQDDGSEWPNFTIYQKDGDKVRVFYSEEMPKEAADPGQDPRVIDVASLWQLLDFTPEGRGTDWYPKLSYS